MNKKLLAAAVAAAMAAPAAFADTAIIYGKLHPQVVSADRDTLASGDVDQESVGDALNTRLGFRGSEDLGDGLKAIWQYEMAYDLDQAAGVQSTRNSYLGLSGHYGTVLAGRHDPAGKGSWYGVGLDFLDGSIIDLNLLGGQSSANDASLFTLFADDARWSNVVHYASPSFSGFSFAATIGAPEGTTDESDSFEAYSLGALYKGHGLKLGAGYTDSGDSGLLHGDTVANDGNEFKYWHLSGSYTWSGLTVGATYNDQEDITPGNDADSFAIAGKYSFGNNYVAGNVSWADFDGMAAWDGEAFEWGVAIGHNFSKRTQVYLAYNDGEREFDASGRQDDELDAFALGMIHVF